MGCGVETRTLEARAQWSPPRCIEKMPPTTWFLRYCFLWLWTAFICPYLAYGGGAPDQERCRDFSRAIYHRMTNLPSLDPPTLESILVEIEEARACFGDGPTVDVSWLMLQQGSVLKDLQRYEEAEALVDLMFTRQFEMASENYRAKFYMQRFHLAMTMGKHQAARRAYTEGLLYRRYLPVHQQAMYELNGAILAINAEEYLESAVLAKVAYDLVQDPQTPEAEFARAKALQVRAEAMYRQGENLKEAAGLFRNAIAEFERLGRLKPISVSYILLGRCLVMDGDLEAGIQAMEMGLNLARRESNKRSEVLALHRLGITYNEKMEPVKALGYLDLALDLMTEHAMAEFLGDVHLGRGNALAQQQQLDLAQEAYKEALALASDAREDAYLRAEAHAGLTEIHGLRLESRSRWFAAFLLLSLVLGGGIGYGLSRRKNLERDAQPLPEPKTAPLLNARDQHLLSLIQALCFDTEAQQEALDAYDVTLYAQLTSTDQKALQSVKIFALALAALDGFTGRAPYETYRKRLTQLRISLGWRVGAPRGLYGWRIWFMEQEGSIK